MSSTSVHQKVLNSGKEFNVGKELSSSNLNRLIRCLGSFSKLFINEFEQFTVTNAGSCAIRTTTNGPVVSPPKQLSKEESELLRTKIEELTRLGWIAKSNSAYGSNAFIREVNGRQELCVDYKSLNETTEPFNYCSVNLDEDFMYIRRSTIFTKIVLKDAFRQIPMNASDRKKTAFQTAFGKFEWNVMPYGLINNQQILLKTIHKALGDLCLKTKVFYGHILVASSNPDEHFDLLEMVLTKLRNANLKIDAGRSSFGVDRVEFAGCLISRDGKLINDQVFFCVCMCALLNVAFHPPTGFSIKPDKLEKIKNAATPRSADELRSFVALANAYKKYIQDYEMLVHPLTELSKKANWNWNSNAQQAFDALKLAFVNASPLFFFAEDEEKRMRLKTEICSNGYTGVLEIEDESKWKPIVYCGLRYESDEENDAEADDEEYCLEIERDAILFAVDQFAMYLDFGRHFTIVTKHHSFDFMPFLYYHLKHDFEKFGELNFYASQLEDYEYAFEHDPTSGHVLDHHCFDGSERHNDDDLIPMFSSDSDTVAFDSDSD